MLLHGLSLVAVRGATLHCGAQASHCGGFSCWRTWAVEHMGFRGCGSQALEHGLGSCGARGLSCSVACGIFMDQGLNPGPLHWQADSYPLYHQGSPKQAKFKYINIQAYPFYCASLYGTLQLLHFLQIEGLRQLCS